MPSVVAQRGLVYKCTRCRHMGPKVQMFAHVVEAHLPQEDVPFWCGICSKRFYLADHHKRRHTEEEFLSMKSAFELSKRDTTQQSWEVSEDYYHSWKKVLTLTLVPKKREVVAMPPLPTVRTLGLFGRKQQSRSPRALPGGGCTHTRARTGGHRCPEAHNGIWFHHWCPGGDPPPWVWCQCWGQSRATPQRSPQRRPWSLMPMLSDVTEDTPSPTPPSPRPPTPPPPPTAVGPLHSSNPWRHLRVNYLGPQHRRPRRWWRMVRSPIAVSWWRCLRLSYPRRSGEWGDSTGLNPTAERECWGPSEPALPGRWRTCQNWWAPMSTGPQLHQIPPLMSGWWRPSLRVWCQCRRWSRATPQRSPQRRPWSLLRSSDPWQPLRVWCQCRGMTQRRPPPPRRQ